MKQTREELEEELLGYIHFDRDGGVTAKELVEWVIADRRRVASPMMVMMKPEFPRMTSNGQLNALWDSGKEVLDNAGLE